MPPSVSRITTSSSTRLRTKLPDISRTESWPLITEAISSEATLANNRRPGLVAVIDVTTPTMVAKVLSKVTNTAWVRARRIRTAARLKRES